MANYVLAVSGGIDSVVLLDMFDWPADTIVAHFNHGIRPSADADCAFVKRLSRRYGFEFVSEKAALGQNCSENLARQRRYDFLRRIAKAHQAEIVTAHHADDCIESIAINCLRGTGWRGLAPLDNPEIFRPMLALHKADIYRYAAEHRLSFRLDQTNNEEQYLRNRLRRILQPVSPFDKAQLLQYYHRQLALKAEIDQLMQGILGTRNYIPRKLLLESGDAGAELLRFFLRTRGCLLTRPQANRCLREIKNFTPGKKYSLDKTHFLEARRQAFHLC